MANRPNPTYKPGPKSLKMQVQELKVATPAGWVSYKPKSASCAHSIGIYHVAICVAKALSPRAVASYIHAHDRLGNPYPGA